MKHHKILICIFLNAQSTLFFIYYSSYLSFLIFFHLPKYLNDLIYICVQSWLLEDLRRLIQFKNGDDHIQARVAGFPLVLDFCLYTDTTNFTTQLQESGLFASDCTSLILREKISFTQTPRSFDKENNIALILAKEVFHITHSHNKLTSI